MSAGASSSGPGDGSRDQVCRCGRGGRCDGQSEPALAPAWSIGTGGRESAREREKERRFSYSTCN